MPLDMLTFPNAKINIGLSITGKRADGYHDLETVFYPVALKDALELLDTPGKEASLHLSGLAIDGDLQKNLAWKAYMLLQQDFPKQVGAFAIYLHKLIPMGAGLGGGSADGAFMLGMLNDHCRLGLDSATLERYALTLGSDCPFFIRNKACFAKGRGEQMEDIALDLSGYSIQLVCPELHISTAAAFSGITPAPAPYPLADIANLPMNDWKYHIKNDFEHSLFPAYPVLSEIKEQLYAGDALYASLSGTGSTVYGIFAKGKKAIIQSDTTFNEHYIQ